MIFKEMGKNIESNKYYQKNSYDENESKVSLHLRISPRTANDFTKAIAVYRNFGVDKYELIKSDFAEMIIREFLDDLNDDESTIIELIGKMKAFRDGDASNE